MMVTLIVPETSWRTPKLGGSKSGDQFVPVRKSTIETSWKNSNAGTKSAITIPTVVATEISAQMPRATLTTSSPYRLRLARSRGSAPAVMSDEANDYPRAASKSLFAFVNCSSVSGTNCEASAIAASLSRMYCMNASTSGRASASFFT